MKLTQKQYLKNGGTSCPVCGADEVTGGSAEVDAGSAWQPVTCDVCGCSWNDVYTLTGFSELKDPDGKDADERTYELPEPEEEK